MVPELERLIQAHQNIVFFGGAGVSTESGIPDFRSVDGLYHQKFKYPPETMLSHTFYEQHTAEFFDFYRQKLIVHGAKPNAAHLRLAKLEREGKLKAVVTQNIDGLHQAAGSKTVYELHGSTLRNYCTRCGKFYPVSFIEEAGGKGDGVPRCTACGAFPRSAVNSYHTRKQQIFASVFVRFYTFMTIFFQRQIAPPSPSVSLSAWPMGLFTSRVAIPSAGVGCLLMTTRSSPRK